MRKKIIFVTQALWCGGIETALVNMLNHFDYEKYDVTLLTLRAIFDFDMKERIDPRCRVLSVDRERKHSFDRKYKYVRLYHLTEETENPSKMHQLIMWTVPAIKWTENRLYIRYIRDLMKGEHFDTAIIYSDVAAETAIRAVNADKFLMFYHHGAMRHVYHDKIAYKKCEKIIAVSQNQAEELKKFVPKYKEKIIAIHNLTDVEGIRAKAAQATEEAFDESKFNIVSVGRVSHEKGMDIAVEVCAKLVADGFDNICWWIVGDGPAMPEVQAAVKELNMQNFVKLVGMKSNPYPYIKQADLYVQPSRFEGYPMTILEALVLGQPVVSTNNNGAKEILQNGKSGLLRPADTDALKDALKMLICEDNIFQELKNYVSSLDFIKQNEQYMEELQKFL